MDGQEALVDLEAAVGLVWHALAIDGNGAVLESQLRDIKERLWVALHQIALGSASPVNSPICGGAVQEKNLNITPAQEQASTTLWTILCGPLYTGLDKCEGRAAPKRRRCEEGGPRLDGLLPGPEAEVNAQSDRSLVGSLRWMCVTQGTHSAVPTSRSTTLVVKQLFYVDGKILSKCLSIFSEALLFSFRSQDGYERMTETLVLSPPSLMQRRALWELARHVLFVGQAAHEYLGCQSESLVLVCALLQVELPARETEAKGRLSAGREAVPCAAEGEKESEGFIPEDALPMFVSFCCQLCERLKHKYNASPRVRGVLLHVLSLICRVFPHGVLRAAVQGTSDYSDRSPDGNAEGAPPTISTLTIATQISKVLLETLRESRERGGLESTVAEGLALGLSSFFDSESYSHIEFSTRSAFEGDLVTDFLLSSLSLSSSQRQLYHAPRAALLFLHQHGTSPAILSALLQRSLPIVKVFHRLCVQKNRAVRQVSMKTTRVVVKALGEALTHPENRSLMVDVLPQLLSFAEPALKCFLGFPISKLPSITSVSQIHAIRKDIECDHGSFLDLELRFAALLLESLSRSIFYWVTLDSFQCLVLMLSKHVENSLTGFCSTTLSTCVLRQWSKLEKDPIIFSPTLKLKRGKDLLPFVITSLAECVFTWPPQVTLPRAVKKVMCFLILALAEWPRNDAITLWEKVFKAAYRLLCAVYTVSGDLEWLCWGTIHAVVMCEAAEPKQYAEQPSLGVDEEHLTSSSSIDKEQAFFSGEDIASREKVRWSGLMMHRCGHLWLRLVQLSSLEESVAMHAPADISAGLTSEKEQKRRLSSCIQDQLLKSCYDYFFSFLHRTQYETNYHCAYFSTPLIPSALSLVGSFCGYLLKLPFFDISCRTTPGQRGPGSDRKSAEHAVALDRWFHAFCASFLLPWLELALLGVTETPNVLVWGTLSVHLWSLAREAALTMEEALGGTKMRLISDWLSSSALCSFHLLVMRWYTVYERHMAKIVCSEKPMEESKYLLWAHGVLLVGWWRAQMPATMIPRAYSTVRGDSDVLPSVWGSASLFFGIQERKPALAPQINEGAEEISERLIKDYILHHPFQLEALVRAGCITEKEDGSGVLRDPLVIHALKEYVHVNEDALASTVRRVEDVLREKMHCWMTPETFEVFPSVTQKIVGSATEADLGSSTWRAPTFLQCSEESLPCSVVRTMEALLCHAAHQTLALCSSLGVEDGVALEATSALLHFLISWMIDEGEAIDTCHTGEKWISVSVFTMVKLIVLIHEAQWRQCFVDLLRETIEWCCVHDRLEKLLQIFFALLGDRRKLVVDQTVYWLVHCFKCALSALTANSPKNPEDIVSRVKCVKMQLALLRRYFSEFSKESSELRESQSASSNKLIGCMGVLEAVFQCMSAQINVVKVWVSVEEMGEWLGTWVRVARFSYDSRQRFVENSLSNTEGYSLLATRLMLCLDRMVKVLMLLQSSNVDQTITGGADSLLLRREESVEEDFTRPQPWQQLSEEILRIGLQWAMEETETALRFQPFSLERHASAIFQAFSALEIERLRRSKKLGEFFVGSTPLPTGEPRKGGVLEAETVSRALLASQPREELPSVQEWRLMAGKLHFLSVLFLHHPRSEFSNEIPTEAEKAGCLISLAKDVVESVLQEVSKFLCFVLQLGVNEGSSMPLPLLLEVPNVLYYIEHSFQRFVCHIGVDGKAASCVTLDRILWRFFFGETLEKGHLTVWMTWLKELLFGHSPSSLGLLPSEQQRFSWSLWMITSNFLTRYLDSPQWKSANSVRQLLLDEWWKQLSLLMVTQHDAQNINCLPFRILLPLCVPFTQILREFGVAERRMDGGEGANLPQTVQAERDGQAKISLGTKAPHFFLKDLTSACSACLWNPFSFSTSHSIGPKLFQDLGCLLLDTQDKLSSRGDVVSGKLPFSIEECTLLALHCLRVCRCDDTVVKDDDKFFSISLSAVFSQWDGEVWVSALHDFFDRVLRVTSPSVSQNALFPDFSVVVVLPLLEWLFGDPLRLRKSRAVPSGSSCTPSTIDKWFVKLQVSLIDPVVNFLETLWASIGERKLRTFSALSLAPLYRSAQLYRRIFSVLEDNYRRVSSAPEPVMAADKDILIQTKEGVVLKLFFEIGRNLVQTLLCHELPLTWEEGIQANDQGVSSFDEDRGITSGYDTMLRSVLLLLSSLMLLRPALAQSALPILGQETYPGIHSLRHFWQDVLQEWFCLSTRWSSISFLTSLVEYSMRWAVERTTLSVSCGSASLHALLFPALRLQELVSFRSTILVPLIENNVPYWVYSWKVEEKKAITAAGLHQATNSFELMAKLCPHIAPDDFRGPLNKAYLLLSCAGTGDVAENGTDWIRYLIRTCRSAIEREVSVEDSLIKFLDTNTSCLPAIHAKAVNRYYKAAHACLTSVLLATQRNPKLFVRLLLPHTQDGTAISASCEVKDVVKRFWLHVVGPSGDQRNADFPLVSSFSRSWSNSSYVISLLDFLSGELPNQARVRGEEQNISSVGASPPEWIFAFIHLLDTQAADLPLHVRLVLLGVIWERPHLFRPWATQPGVSQRPLYELMLHWAALQDQLAVTANSNHGTSSGYSRQRCALLEVLWLVVQWSKVDDWYILGECAVMTELVGPRLVAAALNESIHGFLSLSTCRSKERACHGGTAITDSGDGLNNALDNPIDLLHATALRCNILDTSVSRNFFSVVLEGLIKPTKECIENCQPALILCHRLLLLSGPLGSLAYLFGSETSAVWELYAAWLRVLEHAEFSLTAEVIGMELERLHECNSVSPSGHGSTTSAVSFPAQWKVELWEGAARVLFAPTEGLLYTGRVSSASGVGDVQRVKSICVISQFFNSWWANVLSSPQLARMFQQFWTQLSEEGMRCLLEQASIPPPTDQHIAYNVYWIAEWAEKYLSRGETLTSKQLSCFWAGLAAFVPYLTHLCEDVESRASFPLVRVSHIVSQRFITEQENERSLLPNFSWWLDSSTAEERRSFALLCTALARVNPSYLDIHRLLQWGGRERDHPTQEILLAHILRHCEDIAAVFNKNLADQSRHICTLRNDELRVTNLFQETFFLLKASSLLFERELHSDVVPCSTQEALPKPRSADISCRQRFEVVLLLASLIGSSKKGTDYCLVSPLKFPSTFREMLLSSFRKSKKPDEVADPYTASPTFRYSFLDGSRGSWYSSTYFNECSTRGASKIMNLKSTEGWEIFLRLLQCACFCNEVVMEKLCDILVKHTERK